MAHFPLFVDLAGKSVVVIGGGAVATRKIKVLTPFGPTFEVISPDICENILQMANDGNILIQKRKYLYGDLKGAFMVISCTSDTETNLKVYEEAKELNIHINSTDSMKKDAFLFPSIVKRGDIVVGISTSGDFPLISGFLRNKLGEAIPPDMPEISLLLKKYRDKLKKSDIPIHKKDTFLKNALSEIINANENNPIFHNKTLLEDKINRMYKDFLKINKV